MEMNNDLPERPDGHQKGCRCDICIIIDGEAGGAEWI